MINNINNDINYSISDKFYILLEKCLCANQFKNSLKSIKSKYTNTHTLDFKIFNICVLQEKHLIEQFSLFNVINNVINNIIGENILFNNKFNNETEMKVFLILNSSFFTYNYKRYYTTHGEHVKQELYNSIMQW